MGDGLGQVVAMFGCRAEHHHPAMLAQAFGIAVKKQVELIQLLQVGYAAGVEHRALHLDRGRRLGRRRGRGDGVSGAEDALHRGHQAPCPGDDHRVGQAGLAAAMPLQGQGLRQADRLGQAPAPGGIDERKVAVTHRGFHSQHNGCLVNPIDVGAGLPAMPATRCISQTEVMPSQASQLPQVDRGCS